MSSSTVILITLVVAVTAMGFFAARWDGGDLSNFDEWALGGRRFGTIVSWFLLGGDLYTAYTFIAVPGLIYGIGALGFFAIPYGAIAYPIAFVVLTRFWSIAHRRGYATAADFVRDRFGSRKLEIAIALTGVLAALPYIALQLVGMRTVFGGLGGVFAAHGGLVALTISFVLLASYTYTSGLRAPAMIAFVKDALIYITVIAAVVVIPAKLGGWAHIFANAQIALAARPKPSGIYLQPHQYFTYATWALGSSISLFFYPHSITSVLAAKRRSVIARNAALLPIYSILLGFLALLGICGIAAGLTAKDSNAVVPLLIARYFPNWFLGVAEAAIVIGALVPAAIMAIGSANLFASNVLKEFNGQRTNADTRIAKATTLVICALALLFVIAIPVQFALYFQLLGGAWLLQIVPAFAIGLYTRKFQPLGLLIGWVVGMTAATAMAIVTHFTPNITFNIFGNEITGFLGLYAIVLNLIVTTIATLALNALKTPGGADATCAADYA